MAAIDLGSDNFVVPIRLPRPVSRPRPRSRPRRCLRIPEKDSLDCSRQKPSAPTLRSFNLPRQHLSPEVWERTISRDVNSAQTSTERPGVGDGYGNESAMGERRSVACLKPGPAQKEIPQMGECTSARPVVYCLSAFERPCHTGTVTQNRSSRVHGRFSS
jgi:hypothetical protein